MRSRPGTPGDEVRGRTRGWRNPIDVGATGPTGPGVRNPRRPVGLSACCGGRSPGGTRWALSARVRRPRHVVQDLLLHRVRQAVRNGERHAVVDDLPAVVRASQDAGSAPVGVVLVAQPLVDPGVLAFDDDETIEGLDGPHAPGRFADRLGVGEELVLGPTLARVRAQERRVLGQVTEVGVDVASARRLVPAVQHPHHGIPVALVRGDPCRRVAGREGRTVRPGRGVRRRPASGRDEHQK